MVRRDLQAQELSRSRWANARWLVIAPHADDETLGAGALIHEMSARKQLAGVVFLTDGGASHTHRDIAGKNRLIAARRNEARNALRILAPAGSEPVFLGWPDASPRQAGDDEFDRSATAIAGRCNLWKVDAIAVTGRDEPHCDHVAAFVLANEIARRSVRKIDVLEYIVWSPQPPGSDFQVLKTAPMSLGRRRAALAQHRSQMTPLFGEGFRVPSKLLAMKPFDLLYIKR